MRALALKRILGPWDLGSLSAAAGRGAKAIIRAPVASVNRMFMAHLRSLNM
jgi:hypothetical protein